MNPFPLQLKNGLRGKRLERERLEREEEEVGEGRRGWRGKKRLEREEEEVGEGKIVWFSVQLFLVQEWIKVSE